MLADKFKAGAPAPAPLEISSRSEQEVMSTWISHEGPPLVSICCPTYNHAEFLKDALNGFLRQVTSFPFEIVVRDDASTDGTTDIVLDYAARFPNIIRAVIETENQYAKGVRAYPALVPFAKGEFVALCEGDDYWISADKLEKQVGLLRANPQATMSVAHTVMCKYEGDRLECECLLGGGDKDLQDYDDIKSTYFHTSTYVIRADVFRRVLSKYANKIAYGDTAVRWMLAEVGPFAFLREVVSVYRKHAGGIWVSLERHQQIAWEIEAREEFYKHFDPKHRRYHGTMLFNFYMDMLRLNIWTFNNKGPISNLMRLGYFFVNFGIGVSCERLVQRFKRLVLRFWRILVRVVYGKQANRSERK